MATPDDSPDLPLFVPGRLCLIGEHSDWAAEMGLHPGFCLVIGTDQGLSASARLDSRFTVETLVIDDLGRPTGRTRSMSCPWRHDALLTAAQDPDEFFRYAAGVACRMITRPDVTGGIDLRITAMDLPLRKGVSSSAAVCILVAKAFDSIYSLNLLPHELMELAYQGEKLTGSQCGRMDQACIYGKTPVLLTFDPRESVRIEPIFPRGHIHMFFVDLGGRKDTVQILADLRAAYPRSGDLQRALGQENEQIVRMAYHALEAGNAARLGELMTIAQENFDRLVAPHSTELASPLLHELLRRDDLQGHTYGGKGVGSQGDGTAQFVARSESDRREAIAKITRACPAMKCFPLDILPTRAIDAPPGVQLRVN